MSSDIIAIPAFNDNYIWMIVHPHSQQAVVIDPGDAMPVIDSLSYLGLSLIAILATHHHWDHINGIGKLLKHKQVPVYGPAIDSIPYCQYKLNDGDIINLEEIDLNLKVIATPGHTLGHIAYFGHGWIFTGDTLFTGGCGRLFEGTPEMLYKSLDKLAQLDPSTLIYCGHEYTVKNLEFALTVEPENVIIQERMNNALEKREKGYPTIPASIELEKQTNPFLRCANPTVRESVAAKSGLILNDNIAVFAALRQWKDQF